MSRTYEMMFPDEDARAMYEHQMNLSRKHEKKEIEKAEKLKTEIENKKKYKIQEEKKAAKEKKMKYANNMEILMKFFSEDAALEELIYFEKLIEGRKKKLK